MATTSIRTRYLAAAISTALAAGGLHAATITVDSADDNVASEYCNLRYALQAINGGSTANVPACSSAVSGSAFGTNDTVEFTYYLTGASITLSQGSLPLTAASLTISGSGQLIDAAGNGSVLAVGENVTLAASRLYLKGGASAEHGGGVTIGMGGHVELTECAVSFNSAAAKGGGLYLAPGATLSLIRSTISGNSAATGAAIFAKSGATVTVTDSLIEGNYASYSAGAIYSSGSVLTLDTATISKNTAPYYSGGVVAFFDTIAISKSTIDGNSGARAGGAFLRSSNGTITNSTVSRNTAVCGYNCGGAIVAENSTLAIIGSTLSGNLAAGHSAWVSGGAMLIDSTTTFVNSTISTNIGVGNRQVSGAAWNFELEGDGLTFINSTVSGNTAAAFFGGAIGGVLLGDPYLSPPPANGGKLTLRNTIMAANTPADSDISWNPYNDTVAAAYSLLGSSQDVAAFNDPGDHNIFSDAPEIAGLADNGGPTKTRALLPDSPALSAGSTALAVFSGQPLNFDQRGLGYLRIFSGTVDIGAFEHQPEDRLFASEFESEP